MAKRKNEGEVIELTKVKAMIRERLEKEHGGVAKFLNSPQGKKFGGIKIRSYLYETGATNFDVLSKLSKYLGIGELSRKFVVSRVITYSLNTNVTDTEKTSENA